MELVKLSLEEIIGELEEASQNGELSRAREERLRRLISDSTRPRLMDTIDRSALMPQTLELIEKLKLDEQYEDQIRALADFGFLELNGEPKEGDVPVPSFGRVMNSFTADEVEVALSYQGGELLLVPECSMNHIVYQSEHPVRGYRLFEYEDELFVLAEDFITDRGTPDTIEGYRPVIVDGQAQDVEFDLTKGLLQQVEALKAARRPGEKGMEARRGMMLLIARAHKGRTLESISGELDRGEIWEDDPRLTDQEMPEVYDDGGYSLSLTDIDLLEDQKRRSSVGGDVLLK
ncbi:MAG: hypothetical protein OEY44_02425 [Candidatus Peregrinibacteria bacterium]|nr:hypothetical protein [Candidatus Peregrinibacteria bacterium]